MESLGVVMGSVLVVALLLLATTGIALWVDRLASGIRARAARREASTRPGGRVVYRRMRLGKLDHIRTP